MGLDLEEPNHWWELLFVDGVIKIENVQGKLQRVAIYLTNNWQIAVKNLAIIESRKFQMIRTDLGIDQHWIVFSDAKEPHSKEYWIDVVYAQIDKELSKSGCVLIEM